MKNLNENLVANPVGNFLNLTDAKLYELCQQYGARARLWRQKFSGLLPEVFKRQLYKKKGFGSIYEFAAKLAGMSEEQVRRVLNLEKKFEATPILKEMLERGEVSVNKLARIASIATPKNQEFWAAQAKILPKAALETLIRDEKSEQQNSLGAMASSMKDGLFEPKSSQKSVPGHTNLQQNSRYANAALDGNNDLQLSQEVRGKLLKLQSKGIDINALILEMLQKREKEILQKKNRISEKANQEANLAAEAEIYGIPPEKSRYIPVETRKILAEEFGTKCSMPTCNNAAEEIHHTQRFSLSKSHNPYYLAPLCKNHHRIAHSIDLKFHEKAGSAVMP